MKELDDFVHQHLDESKFPPLIASVEKAGLGNAGPESLAEAAQRAQIERMRAYARAHLNDPLVKANQNLLPQAGAESWTAGRQLRFYQLYLVGDRRRHCIPRPPPFSLFVRRQG